MSYREAHFHFDPDTGDWLAQIGGVGAPDAVGRGRSIEQAARRLAEQAKVASRTLADHRRRIDEARAHTLRRGPSPRAASDCRCWNEGQYGRVHRENCPIHPA